MTVGQIQRNYIQQNSVGVGFFGFSGFSGFSGQAGVIGLPGGAFLWIDDILIMDSLNGFYRYKGGPNLPIWQIAPINDFGDGVGPMANWKQGVGIPGFVTQVRARALLTDANIPSGIGNEHSCFWAMRLRKVLAVSSFSPSTDNWNPSWSWGYSDANLVVLGTAGGGGRYIVFGPLIGTAVSAVWMGKNIISGTTGTVTGFETSGLETPFVALAGDGNYMVEVMDFHFGNNFQYGWVPDKVYIEFAEVKT